MPQMVKEVMTERVVKLSENGGVIDAAKKMADENVGTVVEVDGNDNPIGIVTDRKLTTDVLARGMDPSSTKIENVMTRLPLTTRQDSDVCEVIEKMQSNDIRRFPVVDDKQRIVGVISISDIAKEHANNCGDCSNTILEIASRYA